MLDEGTLLQLIGYVVMKDENKDEMKKLRIPSLFRVFGRLAKRSPK